MNKENLYTPNCIRTYSGIYVNVFAPTPDMFIIEDIAHALSNIPRFGGHYPKRFSVADHCLNCTYHIADTSLKLTALMHDASEAYLLDLPKPIKNGIPQYVQLEDGLMKIISEKFGFIYPLPEPVKYVDKEMLEFEWRCWMEGSTVDLPTHDHSYNDFIRLFKSYKRS